MFKFLRFNVCSSRKIGGGKRSAMLETVKKSLGGQSGYGYSNGAEAGTTKFTSSSRFPLGEQKRLPAALFPAGRAPWQRGLLARRPVPPTCAVASGRSAAAGAERAVPGWGRRVDAPWTKWSGA
jgi:hypothetical protein